MGRKKTLRRVGVVIGLVGIGLITYVLFPIVGYELVGVGRVRELLLPIPKGEEARILSSRGSLHPGEDGVDFTKASNWFDQDLETEFVDSAVRYYTVSIPSLKISAATVAVGGEDLSENLIQYPGTALPGKRGNGVIFGHSVLPQFFDESDYLTIFSTLPRIKKGEVIEVGYDGINYQYVVEDTFEVQPTDIEILAQNTSDSFLTLVTCVPPGHPLRPKRLIVRARLVPLNERIY